MLTRVTTMPAGAALLALGCGAGTAQAHPYLPPVPELPVPELPGPELPGPGDFVPIRR